MNLYEYQGQGHLLRFNILIFSLETAKLIGANFQLYPPWDDGTKVCSNGPGHMINMAALPTDVKKNLNFFFSGTKMSMTLSHRHLVCSIGCSSTSKFVQMMTLC